VTEVVVPRSRAELPAVRDGDAFLAGGTALLGAPADHLRRLVDISELPWSPYTVRPDGLEIAATCTIAALRTADLPLQWAPGAWLIEQCVQSFLASFKIWNRGTVGGNLCVGYPAGPMISLAAACEGSVLVWRPDGSDAVMSVTDFVLGDAVTALRPGELLRSIHLDGGALGSRFAHRKVALAPLGRSSAVIIARDSGAEHRLTLTASTTRPYVLSVPVGAAPPDLAARIDNTVRGNWVDDMYGAADWRRHITVVLAAQVLDELAAGT
jgi:CO/xanthine dehydrogenase FAD-binding subunit